MEDTAVVTEVTKKSAFSAKTPYEYRKLVFPEPYLIDMKLQEEKEELILTYDMDGKKPLSELRGEDIMTILAVLVNLDSIKEGLKEYAVALNPENLYYDRNRQVYAKVRDVYPAGRGYQEEEFTEDYRALTGAALQKRYTYEDYKKGGKRLLGKTPLLTKVYDAQTADEIKEALLKEYDRIEQERREKKMLLDKGTYKKMKAALIILGVLVVLGGGALGYTLLKQMPYKDAVIGADNAYIETDYVGCIDAMKGVDVPEMELHQKYILANSYVRSENLTQEQKDNILKNISLNESPVRLEYWIYLGRGEADQAIDIAMQQSDDQLLLYAYMKKRSAIEADTSLGGDEKTQQLEDISSRMEPLMEQYETEEE